MSSGHLSVKKSHALFQNIILSYSFNIFGTMKHKGALKYDFILKEDNVCKMLSREFMKRISKEYE